MGFSLFTLACLLLFLLSSGSGNHIGETLWVCLVILLGETISDKPLDAVSLTISPFFQHLFPMPEVHEWFVDVFIGNGLHSSVF